MYDLTTNEEVEQIIKNNDIAIVYFSGKTCGACDVIKNKVNEIIEIDFPKVAMGTVDGDKYIKLAANYSVFSLPLLILYVDGKETFRISRNFSVLEFTDILVRYYKMMEL